MHFVPSSFLLLLVRPGAPSSVLSPTRTALSRSPARSEVGFAHGRQWCLGGRTEWGRNGVGRTEVVRNSWGFAHVGGGEVKEFVTSRDGPYRAASRWRVPFCFRSPGFGPPVTKLEHRCSREHSGQFPHSSDLCLAGNEGGWIQMKNLFLFFLHSLLSTSQSCLAVLPCGRLWPAFATPFSQQSLSALRGPKSK